MTPITKMLILDRWAAYKAGNLLHYSHLKQGSGTCGPQCLSKISIICGPIYLTESYEYLEDILLLAC